ncbi:platelet endothelial cell adhesion molecule isoform X2 [Archocentrus centrarchus]|uniref:platelet endothelial cell adhesion molecule isoform X2 n=1 Tax=Archocentrus centrarchus TaxID=63155 RepID=UPI0011E9E570|nr:platelet endothelial cell adhesion molecule-like isoform X2 [Archocentrus centrarchus]
MGRLLLLLTFTVLSSYFCSASVVNAQHDFKIQSIVLTIEPRNPVGSGTNVTLRCSAKVSTRSGQVLTAKYKILKDDNIVYTKTARPSEDVLYELHNARVFNSAMYQCQINIHGDQKMSEPQTLKVKGLSEPVLHLSMTTINEGEELAAHCTARGEAGSFTFFFFQNNKQVGRVTASSNTATANISLKGTGNHKLHCSYKVRTADEFVSSENSSIITVSVKELSITPALKIFPESGIYEGDRLNISCSALFQSSSQSYRLSLSQGTKLHGTGNSTINHNLAVVADDPEGLTFDCRVEVKNVEKYINKTISVSELFSAPTLTMSPTEVFQGDPMTLTCRSERFARQRINREDLIYSLYPSEIPPSSSQPGVFRVTALKNDFNYTCSAEAKGIKKHSKTLSIRPKVLVSTPKISVEDNVILNRSFRIFCQSDGSLPINYTLFKNNSTLDTKIIKEPNHQAIFRDTINEPKINEYRCEAKNSRHSDKTSHSQNLRVNVIVPLSQMTLTVIPSPPIISEGEDVTIICRVKGTGPVTFKWYRAGSRVPLNTNTTKEPYASYYISALYKNDSDRYHCEASNSASNIVSEEIDVQVLMALWKKALIWGVVLLLATVLVLVAIVLYVKSKRVRVDRAEVSVWSKGKPEAGSDDEISKVSSEVSNEPDVEYTEVMLARAADPGRGPLRKGTDTVYSELQNSPHGAADHRDYGSVEYAELNHEQLEMSQYHPQVSGYQDLPEPVD